MKNKGIFMAVEITMRKLIWELSGAIDMVGITDLSHGKRVAYIADMIRGEMKDFPWSRDNVIIAGLLHDCGVSSTDLHEHLVHEMEYKYAEDHCIRGKNLLKDHNQFRHIAQAVGYHHTRWCYLNEGNDEILGNLLFLSDRIDVISKTSKGDILLVKDQICSRIKNLSGILFKPELVNCFLEIASKDIFWLNWDESHSGEVLKSWLNSEPPETVLYEDLIKPISLLSSCIDGKSTYTYNHSRGVAALSRRIAELDGYNGEALSKIELAGLMHDIGKLKVPDAILEKDSSLTIEESYIMRHHSYDTYCILSKIDGMEDVCKWASQHHEKLNGEGYPSSEKKQEIPRESRILAIADIFHALAQKRPYRNAWKIEKILEFINDQCLKGELDDQLVDLVNKNSYECMELSSKYIYSNNNIYQER